MTENQKEQLQFSDYTFILFKWKKFLLINLFCIAVIVTIIAFLIPKEYRATATVMIPQNEQMGLGSLTNLLGGKSSIAAMGSKFFGVVNTSEDVLLGILYSRRALTSTIYKFKLLDYYDIDDNNMDKAIKAFKSDISAEPNEYGMIDFSIVNKNPKKSAEIANFIVTLVDSLNIQFNIERSKQNRTFIEKRYIQNVSDLKKAEDSLYKFQKKYNLVAIPEQLEISVKAAAEIEAELTKKQMQAFIVKQQFGETSPQYIALSSEINLLNKKVQELKNSSSLSASSNIFYPFNEMPDIAIKYLRTYREVEIQQSILELVMPMYEQAKVEEQKSIPTILIIDKAVPPQIKYSPRKSLIIIGVLFLAAFILIPLIFWMEITITRTNYSNPLQIKLARIFRKTISFYKLKF